MVKYTRAIIVLAGVAVLFLGFFGSRILGNQKKPPKRNDSEASVKVVRTLDVKPGVVQSGISISGKLVATQKMAVIAEVPGRAMATSTAFKEGNRFNRGAALLRIDAGEASMALLAQRSSLQTALTQIMPDLRLDYQEEAPQWEQYLEGFEVNASLKPFPEVKSPQLKRFLSARNIYSQYYNIKASEERLQKYTLIAPFSGIVTSSNFDPGNVVVTGQRLGEFLNPNSYELEVAVSGGDLAFIQIGDKVNLKSDILAGSWEGRIKRISNKIDPNTQTIRVFVAVSGANLKEGMYLYGEVEGGTFDNAVAIPRQLVRDSQVFTVNDSVLLEKPVTVLRISDDLAIVRGLSAGTQVLNENIIGAYDGMKVKRAGQKMDTKANSNESAE